jgi:hypothetical protein
MHFASRRADEHRREVLIGPTPWFFSRVKRLETWADPLDTQAVVLDAEGKFEVHGLPTEWYSLCIGLKGYHFSTTNHSIEQINRRLVGTIDQDIAGLKILLEPGGE